MMLRSKEECARRPAVACETVESGWDTRDEARRIAQSRSVSRMTAPAEIACRRASDSISALTSGESTARSFLRSSVMPIWQDSLLRVPQHRGKHRNISQGICYVVARLSLRGLRALQEPSVPRGRVVPNILSAVRNCPRC